MQHSVNFPALLPLNVFGGEVSHGGGQTRHSWGGTAQVLAAQGWYATPEEQRVKLISIFNQAMSDPEFQSKVVDNPDQQNRYAN